MKKLKLTKVITSLLIVASVLALNPIGASAEWKQDSNGWWNTEGSSYSTGWRSIDGKWYYFYDTGYMASNAWVNGYYVGADGTIPQSVGFNKIPLSNESSKSTTVIGTRFVNRNEVYDFYNKLRWTTNKINSLSIANTNYLKDYENTGNILGITQDQDQDDYVIKSNGVFSRFTAIAGIDDLSGSNGNCTLQIIADGTILDTKKLIAGENAVNIDVNLNGYQKVIIRVSNLSNEYKDTYYDILGAKFYY